ncbi:hypothetical protein PR202_ga28401 [Eleusine coracana subsp. coracana]|uniref:Uncharacterized protein n=1 Tax=Eleusine coracana subsp. coracana TaxID=191504 RepID=A0AAV5DJM9_ELECO|nr:hypothetical protein PR202_ga28401 [Eleusine coracana subsp. coracana]
MALRLRWLWRHKTECDRLGSSFPIKEDAALSNFFKASVEAVLGDGTLIKFWTDPWIQGRSIESLAPSLFRAVSTRNRNHRLVVDALPHTAWRRDITGALTAQVLLEYTQLRQLLDGISLQQTPDRFIWRSNPKGEFSFNSAYRAMFLSQTATFGELWQTRAKQVPFLCLVGAIWSCLDL